MWPVNYLLKLPCLGLSEVMSLVLIAGVAHLEACEAQGVG